MKLFDWHREKKRAMCAAVIVAAGSATRMQGIDKITASLRGEPVIVHTVRAFQAASCIDEIIVVAREDKVTEISDLLAGYDFNKVRTVIPGGDTRMASVVAGLMATSKGTVLAAVQDGARPLVTPKDRKSVV